MRFLQGKVVEIVSLVAGLAILAIALDVAYAKTFATLIGVAFVLCAGLALVSRQYLMSEIDCHQQMRVAYETWERARLLEEASARASLIHDAFSVMDNVLTTDRMPWRLVRNANAKELVFLDHFARDRALAKGLLLRTEPLFWFVNEVNRRLGRDYERRRVQRECYDQEYIQKLVERVRPSPRLVYSA